MSCETRSSELNSFLMAQSSIAKVHSSKFSSSLRISVPVIACLSLCVILTSFDGDIFHFLRKTHHSPVKWASGRESYCYLYITQYSSWGLLHPMLQLLRDFPYPIEFMDIDANVGYVSLPALACLGQPHSVLSIEPVQRNLNRLLSNAALIGAPVGSRKWFLLHAGLSDTDNFTVIHLPGNRTDNAALSKSSAVSNVHMPIESAHNETIIIRRGDAVLNELKFNPSVIKIDVQGSELFALRGMKKYLSQNRDIIVMSEHDRGLMLKSGVKADAVFVFMEKLGFKAYCNAKFKIRNKSPIVTEGTLLTNREQFISSRGISCGDVIYVKSWLPFQI